MRKFILLFILAALTTAGAAQTATLRLENRLPVDRNDEPIVLTRKWLEKKLGAIPKGKYVQVTAHRQPVLVQYDDLQKEGRWTELFLLLHFNSKEQKTLQLSVSDHPAAIKAVVRSYARHKRLQPDKTFGEDLLTDSIPAGQQATDFGKHKLPPFLTEGPAWENDKVGFRLYSDVRNGKDIWGKTTTAMVLAEVGADTTAKSYHEKADWGMDILKVGKSLGAGSWAVQMTNNGKDTIVRLGGLEMGPITYELLANGPLRSVIRLIYPQWQLPGQSTTASFTETITIRGGQYGYNSEVAVKNLPPGARLVTGMVSLYPNDTAILKDKTTTAMASYGLQSENKDGLGLAVMSKNQFFGQPAEAAKTGEVQDTHLLLFRKDLSRITSTFYACWEGSLPAFNSKAGFLAYLQGEQARAATPIVVR